MLKRKNAKDVQNLKEEGGLIVQPVRMYDRRTSKSFKDIKVGDILIAKVISFIEPTINLKIGDMYAIMDFYDFQNINKEEKLYKSIYSSIGQRIIARVISKEDGIIKLERKSIIEETVEVLSQKSGEIVSGTVEAISSDIGIFVDVGNGYRTLVPKKELTKSFVSGNLNCYFRIGDKTKVKILEYDEEKKFLLVSIKEAYPVLDEYALPRKSAIIVTCFGFVNENKDGVFVELDPANNGIVDIPEDMDPNEFTIGRKMSVVIRSNSGGQKFKGRFINFLN